MKLGIPVYQGVNLLDVTGPLEIFYWTGASKEDFGQAQDLQTVLISADGNPVTSIEGVTFKVGGSFENTPTLDVLWVPGGKPAALAGLMGKPDSSYIKYLRQVAKGAKWVCSVCEGALLLARAGLLDGHKVTTHWAFLNCLKDRQKFPGINPADVDTAYRRFVVSTKGSENRLTGGGISSGLDEALQLILLLFKEEIAKNVQRTTQYFPQPPVMGELPWDPGACPVKWD